MPPLDEDQLERIRERPETKCEECGRTLHSNYCRQCDEFYDAGHADNCPNLDPPDKAYGNNHKGHRTY